MGHVSVDAALVYQHRTASRDRAIADALDQMLSARASRTAAIQLPTDKLSPRNGRVRVRALRAR